MVQSRLTVLPLGSEANKAAHDLGYHPARNLAFPDIHLSNRFGKEGRKSPPFKIAEGSLGPLSRV